MSTLVLSLPNKHYLRAEQCSLCESWNYDAEKNVWTSVYYNYCCIRPSFSYLHKYIIIYIICVSFFSLFGAFYAVSSFLVVYKNNYVNKSIKA